MGRESGMEEGVSKYEGCGKEGRDARAWKFNASSSSFLPFFKNDRAHYSNMKSNLRWVVLLPVDSLDKKSTINYYAYGDFRSSLWNAHN